MKQYFALLSLLSLFLLQGCYTQGSSAPAPKNVTLVAGDTSATLSWDALPGVEYWVFKAAGNDVTPASCFGQAECGITPNAVSPVLINNLVNGTTYSFTINGRINGGKGGPGSASVQAVPRLAGAIWTSGTATGSGAVRGIAYGTQYVAVDDTGAIFSSTDGVTWTTSRATPTPSSALYAIAYSSGKYIAVGAGGTILSSTDASTWVQQSNGNTNNLFSVTGNGVGGFVAVGLGGTILTSPDGASWTASSSGTGNILYGISYANSTYVAVGASGTILYSSNAVNWTAATSAAAQLNSVTYGNSIFVALGASGTLLTSSDGANWTVQSSLAGAPTINAATYGHQFIAAGSAGELLTSTDGLTWTLATTATAALYAIAHGPYDYVATGAAGLNLHSK